MYFIIPKLLSAVVGVVLVKKIKHHFSITGQTFGNDIASFWHNVMMSYLPFMITECQSTHAVQIWFQNVRFNLLMKTFDKIHVLIVTSLKSNVIQKRTVRASMLRM